MLGTCCWQWGRNAEAKRYLEQAVRHARACGDTRGAAMALGNLALVEKALGNHANAKAMMLDWLATQREQGEWLRAAVGLNNLAYTCLALGEVDAAHGFLDEGLALCERHALALPRPSLLANLANLHAAAGRLDDAEQVARQAITAARTDSFADVEAAALNQLVRIALRRGDLARARAHLPAAAAAAAAIRHEEVQLDCVFCVARLLAAEGDGRAAAPLLRFYLGRPNLEPADRAEALSCLDGVPAGERGAAPVALPLDALPRGIVADLASTTVAEHRGTPAE